MPKVVSQRQICADAPRSNGPRTRQGKIPVNRIPENVDRWPTRWFSSRHLGYQAGAILTNKPAKSGRTSPIDPPSTAQSTIGNRKSTIPQVRRTKMPHIGTRQELRAAKNENYRTSPCCSPTSAAESPVFLVAPKAFNPSSHRRRQNDRQSKIDDRQSAARRPPLPSRTPSHTKERSIQRR